MVVQSTMFGEIEVEPDKVYRFPDGLLGFEELTSFILIDAEELRPLTWLVSLDEPEITFPLADPKYFVESYDVPIGAEDRDLLDVEADDNVAIFTIVRLPQDGESITANLRGPIVLNLSSRIGRQVVLKNEAYGHRHDLITTPENISAK